MVSAGDRAPRTLERYKQHLDGHVLPGIGHIQVQKLTADALATFLRDRQSAGLSPWTRKGMVQYLLDADENVVTPGIDPPQTDFADAVAPVALALGQEKRVTEQIIELVKLAREEGELVGEQFLHWFLQEQREEVASMTELLAIVDRGKDNLLTVEEYLSRSSGGENPLEAGAPPAAGGAL